MDHHGQKQLTAKMDYKSVSQNKDRVSLEVRLNVVIRKLWNLTDVYELCGLLVEMVVRQPSATRV